MPPATARSSPDARASLSAGLQGSDAVAEVEFQRAAGLQALHEQGVLDILRGALGAKDELIESAVATANTPETIRAIRNLLFWRRILGGIEPEWFKGIFQAIPEGLAQATAERNKPVGLWGILRRIRSKDSLRGMAAAVDFLEAFGRHLHALEAAPRSQVRPE